MKTTKRQLSIVLPGLFEGLQRWPENISEYGAAPGLLWLLSRSSKYCHSHSGFERTLLHGFSSSLTASEELPIAILRSDSDDQAVLCADPVSLELGVSELALVHGRALELTAEEIDELSQYLNEFFEHEQMQWRLDENGYGVIQLDNFTMLSTTPLSSVSGEIFTAKLPQGQEQAKWHQLGNEIQMLLHDSAFNQRRLAEDKLPINSLWFWGAGHKKPEFDAHYNSIIADDQFSKLLATCVDKTVTTVPESFLALDGQIEDGHTLIVLDQLWSLSQKNDYLGWIRQLELYDKLWFQPLLKNLYREHFVSIIIRASTGEMFTYKPYHRFRFWRRSC